MKGPQPTAIQTEVCYWGCFASQVLLNWSRTGVLYLIDQANRKC